MATRTLPVCICIALIAASCGGASFSFSIGGVSVEDAAEKLIEDDIGDQLGIELIADCPTVTNPQVGTEFSCTAATPSGAVIDFAGLVDAEDHIDVSSTNLISSDALGAWETSGAEVVSDLVDDVVEIDCGGDAIVLTASMEMTCTGTDTTGDTAPIIYTITDLDAGLYDIRVGE